MKGLKLPFSYEWTTMEGAIVGSIFGIIVSVLTFVLIKFFAQKENKNPISCATLVFSVIMFSFVSTFPFTPGWKEYGFASEIAFLAIICGTSTYLYLTLLTPFSLKKVEALKLQHSRLVRNISQLMWAFMFAIATIVITYFLNFVSQIPVDLRYSSESIELMFVHALGGIFLIAGSVINIIGLYHCKIIETEREVNKMANQ